MIKMEIDLNISDVTKTGLDSIKSELGYETYDEILLFLMLKYIIEKPNK